MKTLLLIRGLPGSGKTSLARLLAASGEFAHFSIDSFFEDRATGTYCFDYKTNHLAYKKCESDTKQAMLEGRTKIIVEHTFTIEWEMEPYFKMASELGYQVFVMTLENRHGGRNIHGIADVQLQKMASKYKVVLLPENLS